VDDDCYGIRLWADDRQLHQILLNTLMNGLEAASEGAGDGGGNGWVSVSARMEEDAGEGLVLTIADSGQGIDPVSLHRVFNPFFTTKETGTGLGLAIVHKLVEGHGGSITAGRHTDGGAMLTIRLPVGAPAYAEQAALQE